MIGWPTKLALAPLLAKDIIVRLTTAEITPCFHDIHALNDWPKPAIATPMWDQWP